MSRRTSFVLSLSVFAALSLQVSVANAEVPVEEVDTWVLEEVEFEKGELAEISRNFFAQGDDGAVYHFGEVVDDYDPDESERKLRAPGVGVVLEQGDEEKLRLIASTLFPI